MDETPLRVRKCRSDKEVVELSKKSGEGRQTSLVEQTRSGPENGARESEWMPECCELRRKTGLWFKSRMRV